MDIRRDLLVEIEAFIASAGMAESTFGRRAVNDGKLVRRLRNGENITVRTIERAREYMRNHRDSSPEAAE